MALQEEKLVFQMKVREANLDLKSLPIPLASILSSFEYPSLDEQNRSQQIYQVLSQCSLDTKRKRSFFVETFSKLEISNTTKEVFQHLANIALLSENDAIICPRHEPNPILVEHFASLQFHLEEFHWLLELLAITNPEGPVVYPLLTPAKTDIWGLLFQFIHSLLSGEMQRLSTKNSALLLGPRGIGKTVCLQTLARVAGFFTAVRVVYLDYSKRLIRPLDAIKLVALQHGISFDPDDGFRIMFERLKERGIPILLVADELDEVFHSVKEETLRLEVLRDLVSLANNESPQAAVIICGSATCLPRLIKCERKESLLQTFPLIAFSMDMNASKFPSVRPNEHPASDEELDTALSVFLPNTVPEGTEKRRLNRNLCRFFFGENLRLLSVAFKRFQASIQGLVEPLLVATPRELSLLKTLSARFFQKNKSLFDSALLDLVSSTTSSKIDCEAISRVDWSEFRALEHKEVREAIEAEGWTRIELELLADGQFFTIGFLGDVRPLAPFNIFLWAIEPSSLRRVSDQVSQF